MQGGVVLHYEDGTSEVVRPFYHKAFRPRKRDVEVRDSNELQGETCKTKT